MGDIDRVTPVPPAIHAALAAQRAGDHRRRRPDSHDDREAPADTLELHDADNEAVEEVILFANDPDADGLDLAV